MKYIVRVQGRDGVFPQEVEAYSAADAIAQKNLDLDHSFPRGKIYSVEPAFKTETHAGGATVSERRVESWCNSIEHAKTGCPSDCPGQRVIQPATGDGTGEAHAEWCSANEKFRGEPRFSPDACTCGTCDRATIRELKEKLAAAEARAVRVEEQSLPVKCSDCGECLKLTDRGSKPDKSWYAQHHECNKWLARVEEVEQRAEKAEAERDGLRAKVGELEARIEGYDSVYELAAMSNSKLKERLAAWRPIVVAACGGLGVMTAENELVAEIRALPAEHRPEVEP